MRNEKQELERAIATNKEEHQLEVLIQLNDKLQDVLTTHNAQSSSKAASGIGEEPNQNQTSIEQTSEHANRQQAEQEEGEPISSIGVLSPHS